MPSNRKRRYDRRSVSFANDTRCALSGRCLYAGTESAARCAKEMICLLDDESRIKVAPDA